MLTDAQFELIKAVIDKSAITVQEVKDDLIDHFCCSIENYMLATALKEMQSKK